MAREQQGRPSLSPWGCRASAPSPGPPGLRHVMAPRHLAGTHQGAAAACRTRCPHVSAVTTKMSTSGNAPNYSERHLHAPSRDLDGVPHGGLPASATSVSTLAVSSKCTVVRRSSSTKIDSAPCNDKLSARSLCTAGWCTSWLPLARPPIAVKTQAGCNAFSLSKRSYY